MSAIFLDSIESSVEATIAFLNNAESINAQMKNSRDPAEDGGGLKHFRE